MQRPPRHQGRSPRRAGRSPFHPESLLKNVSTRLLMSCAAIGVAGGIIFTVNAWMGGALANLVPLVYGLTIGLYFIPGALAQALIQRPGVGLLTSAFAGLVSSPFQPIFFGAFLIALGIGVMQEIPFLIGRYRTWRPWVFLVGALGAGVITSGAGFQILAANDFGLAGNLVMFLCFGVSPFLWTLVSLWLASALARAGVGRGLRREPVSAAPVEPADDVDARSSAAPGAE